MAGEGYRTWVPGEVITANNVQGYLQDQTVQVYPDAATRDTTLIGFLAEGMLSYLEDTNSVEVYDGSAWVGLGGDAPIFTAGSAGQFLKSLGTAGVDWDDVPIPASATPTTEGVVFARQAGTAAGTALTAFGYEAGPLDYTTAPLTGSTFVGFQAGKVAVSGNNTAVGHLALTANTTGNQNTAVGESALKANTTAFENTAVGASALLSNTTASFNTGVGFAALSLNTTGNQNTAVGHQAIRVNTTGIGNTAVGYQALSANTTGNNNTAFGVSSGLKSTGGNNIYVGLAAGSEFTTGSSNVVVGGASGSSFTSTGSNHTILGSQIGITRSFDGSNNVVIGHQAAPSTSSVSNEITLGNASITTIRAQVTSITSLSDERDKTNVEELEHGLELIKQLRPVSFEWWQRKPEPVELPDGTIFEVDESTLKRGEPDIGFIAQDIVALEDALEAHDQLRLSYRSNPDALEVTQGRLIPILVKAIQELSAEVESLRSQLK